MKTKDIALCGMLCAMAAVLGYIESLLPSFVPVAGFKIGLSNLAVMYALYRLGKGRAFFVTAVKVLITSVWFAGMSAFVYSAFGAALALCAMIAAKRFRFSCRAVGMLGGIFHNIGQLLAACIMLGTAKVIYLAPVLLVSGMITGFLIGTVCGLIIKYTKTAIW